MRLDVVSVPAEQSLGAYLRSGWMDNIDPASVSEFTVNGFPAATATAHGDQWSFRLFAVRFGSDVYRFIFAAKSMTAQADQEFRQAIMTFRRMSLKEAREIKPQHIAIVTVGPHDSAIKLARRMNVADHALEHFRVLNGLGPHDRLKPGMKVKIVQ
jgi:predicted Zn-dependent protease